MSVIPCPPHTREVDELPSLDLTANSESVPAIERHCSPGGDPDLATSTDVEPAEPKAKHRGRTQLLTSLVTVALLAVVVYTLRNKLPSVHSISTALASAQPWWVAVAAALEAVSLGMFALQQRALLRALDAEISVGRAMGVTYARSAIAITMPAGSAVSAAFAYQQYRRSGASRDTAAAVMVLSGLASFAGLGILYILGVAGVVVVSPAKAWHSHAELIITVGAATVATVLAWFVATHWPARRGGVRRAEIVTSAEPTRVRRWLAIGAATVRQNVATWRDVRPRHWVAAITYAILNWLFDLLCLAAAAAAFGMHVSILTLASIYLGVQLVRQVPITPGGIGLIETGLLAGFAALGAPAATAAAVVLTYRILSCWLLIPIGGLAWLGLRTKSAAPAVPQAEIATPALPELAPAEAG